MGLKWRAVIFWTATLYISSLEFHLSEFFLVYSISSSQLIFDQKVNGLNDVYCYYWRCRKEEAGSVVNLVNFGFLFMSFWKHVETYACQGSWSGSSARRNLLTSGLWSTEVTAWRELWYLASGDSSRCKEWLVFPLPASETSYTMLEEQTTKVNILHIMLWHKETIICEKLNISSQTNEACIENIMIFLNYKVICLHFSSYSEATCYHSVQVIPLGITVTAKSQVGFVMSLFAWERGGKRNKSSVWPSFNSTVLLYVAVFLFSSNKLYYLLNKIGNCWFNSWKLSRTDAELL